MSSYLPDPEDLQVIIFPHGPREKPAHETFMRNCFSTQTEMTLAFAGYCYMRNVSDNSLIIVKDTTTSCNLTIKEYKKWLTAVVDEEICG